MLCKEIEFVHWKWNLTIHQYNDAIINTNTLNDTLGTIVREKSALEVALYETNLSLWLYKHKHVMQEKKPIIYNYLTEGDSYLKPKKKAFYVN